MRLHASARCSLCPLPMPSAEPSIPPGGSLEGLLAFRKRGLQECLQRLGKLWEEVGGGCANGGLGGGRAEGMDHPPPPVQRGSGGRCVGFLVGLCRGAEVPAGIQSQCDPLRWPLGGGFFFKKKDFLDVAFFLEDFQHFWMFDLFFWQAAEASRHCSRFPDPLCSIASLVIVWNPRICVREWHTTLPVPESGISPIFFFLVVCWFGAFLLHKCFE